MLELNHGHIVTVASSLGLFTTAGVEVKKKKKSITFFLLVYKYNVLQYVAKMLFKDAVQLTTCFSFYCRIIVRASLEP